MRRGCVHTMLQAPPQPCATASSRMNCGTCVLLPHPVHCHVCHAQRVLHSAAMRGQGVPRSADNRVQRKQPNVLSLRFLACPHK